MPISRVNVEGINVQVYDENGTPSLNFLAPFLSADGKLERYDEHRIYFRAGRSILVYDEHGNCISTHTS